VLERGPIAVNGTRIPTLGAAMITEEPGIDVVADQDAELLLVDVKKELLTITLFADSLITVILHCL
jgi:hypothetical protein